MNPRALWLPIALTAFTAHAQTGIHACTADPDAQRVYNQHRNSPDRIDALRQALATKPDNLFLNRWLLLSPNLAPGSLAEEYRANLTAHPDDPLALYLYGHALIGVKTPQAITLINQSLAKDPELAFAYEALVEIYASKNFADHAKLTQNLQGFTARCPDVLSVYSYLSQVEDPAALSQLTAMFRAAVEKRNTVGVAAEYSNLWTAEFRAADPKDFDRLREQVRKDMVRIPVLDPNNVNGSKSLIHGYRLLGDTTTADALQAKRAPAPIFNDAFETWDKAHPYPKDGNADAVRARTKAMVEASVQWVKDFPEETHAKYWRLIALGYDKDTTSEQLEQAGEAVLASDKLHPQPWTMNPYSYAVASVWVNHDIRLRDSIVLLHRALAELEAPASSADDRKAGHGRPTGPAIDHNDAVMRFNIWQAESLADRKLGDFDATRAVLAKMKVWLDEHPGGQAWLTQTWHEESAALAELEGHKLDAMAHYQQAYPNARSKASANALWTAMGGTDEGFAMWWKPVKPVEAILTPQPWSAENLPLTALNARDLTGKTWTIADLKGKTTLINIWATWCAPCRQELPALQKLYEQMKESMDVQVISINTDDDPGLTDAFLKSGHYTFPVLLAKNLVDDLDSLGIPRNWIVDATGTVRQQGIGYEAADWPDKIVQKINVLY